jgi:hypothetical protein
MAAGFTSCSKDDDSNDTPVNNGPEQEHGDNDGVKGSGDGMSTVVLGGTTFVSAQYDFSNEPKVTDPKTVSAVVSATYAVGKDIQRFKVQGNEIYAFESIDAFTSKILIYNLDSKSITDEAATGDSYIAGFSANGAIMSVKGAENINFYLVEGGKVKNHFFQIKSLNGSKFLSECYLDYNMGFVYNTNELLSFPLDKTSDVNGYTNTVKVQDKASGTTTDKAFRFSRKIAA